MTSAIHCHNMAPTNEHPDPRGHREEKTQIRMSAWEKTEFVRAANAEGLSLSSWMRQLATRELRRLAKDEK